MKPTVVKLIRTDNGLELTSPYHPDFPKRAKELMGRWSASNKVWVFPDVMIPEVRSLCIEFFQKDPMAESDERIDRVDSAKYLIKQLLPILKELNADEQSEVLSLLFNDISI